MGAWEPTTSRRVPTRQGNGSFWPCPGWCLVLGNISAEHAARSRPHTATYGKLAARAFFLRITKHQNIRNSAREGHTRGWLANRRMPTRKAVTNGPRNLLMT